MTTRARGVALTAVALALIALATLRPMPVGPPVPFGHWCIVCGSLGLADVIVNVPLFVPLGAGLWLAGARWRTALVASLAATLTVEALQLTVITGRHATLGDVIMNVAGGLLGFALASRAEALLVPGRRTARALTLGAGALWLAVLGATGWAMGRDAGVGPARAAALAPPYPEVQWYNGGVVRATLDGADVARPDRLPPALVAATRSDAARVDAWVTPTNTPRARFEFFVAVYDADRRSHLVVGRRGRDLVFRARTRSARVRLRQPTVVIRDAFPAHEPPPAPGTWGAGPPTHVAGVLDGRTLRAGVERDGRMEWHEARLSPSLGWALLVPGFRGLDARSPLATAAWLLALLLPVGYWGARWAAGGGRAGAAMVVSALVGGGLAVVPPALGFPVAPVTEWLAAAAGLAGGWALTRALRRREAATSTRRRAASPSPT